MGCIYKIYNNTNGKLYIGSSTNWHKRKYIHLYNLRKNNHPNIHLQRAWNKYGEGSFDLCIMEDNINLASLIAREQYYIDLLAPAYNKRKIADSNLGATMQPFDDKRKENISRLLRKLTDQQVINIKQLVDSGVTYKDVAERIGIPKGSISKIVNGRVYKDIIKQSKPINKNIRSNKLTRNQVIEIYTRLMSGETQYSVAKEFKIDQSTACRIKSKTRSYTWLQDVK